MINKLRFRFIRVTMASIFVVLALIIATINVINIGRHTESLDSITQRLMESRLFMMKKPDGAGDMAGTNLPDFSGFNLGRPFLFQNEKELPFSTRFFSIRVDENDGAATRCCK